MWLSPITPSVYRTPRPLHTPPSLTTKNTQLTNLHNLFTRDFRGARHFSTENAHNRNLFPRYFRGGGAHFSNLRVPFNLHQYSRYHTPSVLNTITRSLSLVRTEGVGWQPFLSLPGGDSYGSGDRRGLLPLVPNLQLSKRALEEAFGHGVHAPA